MSDIELQDSLTECRIRLVLFEDEIFITQMKISKMLEWLIISEKYVSRINDTSAYRVISTAIEDGNSVVGNLREIQRENMYLRRTFCDQSRKTRRGPLQVFPCRDTKLMCLECS